MIYVEELRIAKRVLKNIKVGNFILSTIKTYYKNPIIKSISLQPHGL